MAEQNLIEDGSTSFISGQNAAHTPEQVPENGYFSGVNTSTENGVINPRWGLEQIIPGKTSQTYKTDTGLPRLYSDLLEFGHFQALIPYSINDVSYLIAISAGVIFLINQQTFAVTIIEIKDGSKLNERAGRINFSDAGRYLVLFDFPARSVIIEGATARRANPGEYEVPISRLGAFNQTRLIVANGGNEFVASDPTAYGFPYAPISFTEYLKPGGTYYTEAFQISTNYNNDPITGIYALPVSDTSTGIGPTLVSTQKSIYSYQTQNDRSTWNRPNFGSLFISNSGFAGPRSMDGVNSDVYYLASDGTVRSASMSRSEQTKWSKVPLSDEVKNFLKVHDKSLLQYGRVCYFRNKVFITANPYREVSLDSNFKPVFDYVHGGMVVLELDNMSTFTTGDSNPAWAGLWTGMRPMDMVVNNQEAFIVSREGGRNVFYKVRPDLRYDLRGAQKTIRQIKSKVYTKQYTHRSPFSNKELRNLELAMQNIQGKFKVVVKYKTSHSSKFQLWGCFDHYAPWQICKVNGPCELRTLLPHQFRDMNLGSPIENECNPVTLDKAELFRKIQLLFEIEGINWELQGFIIRAIAVTQNTTQAICNETIHSPEICQDCETDWVMEEDEVLCQKT